MNIPLCCSATYMLWLNKNLPRLFTSESLKLMNMLLYVARRNSANLTEVNDFFSFERGSHYIALTRLEPAILLPQSPEYQDYRDAPLCLTEVKT